MRSKFVWILFATLISSSILAGQGVNPFVSRPEGAPTTPPAESGIVLPGFLVDIQRTLHGLLSSATSGILKEDGGYDWGSLAVVLLIAFAYGVFHALGPGHGKALVGTLFLSRPARIRQSLSLGYLIAIIHAVVAVGVVLIIMFILQSLFTTTFETVSYWTTIVSYGAIVLIGFLMLLSSVVNVASGGKRHFHIHLPIGKQKHRHEHGEHHGHGEHETSEAAEPHDGHSAPGLHENHSEHSHGDSVSTLDKPSTSAATATPVAPTALKFPEIAATAFASAVIPCPGAATIMVFSVSLGLPVVGALAVLFLSLGMGITTSLVGLLAILVQRGVLKAASLGGNRIISWVAAGLRIAGSAALFCFGLLLFLSQV